MTEPRVHGSQPSRHVVVTAPAEIDLVNATGLSDQLTAACRSGDVITVDMTATTFCDSAGVRAIARAWELAGAHGGELRLAIGSSPARRIFQLTGLDQIVPVYPDVPQSLRTPRAGPVAGPGSAV